MAKKGKKEGKKEEPKAKEPQEDAKKGKGKGKGKKGKGKIEEPPESDLQDEILLATTDLEKEPEDLEFTETSYTSASFETLPSLEVVVVEKKKKKKKKIAVEEVVEVEEDFDWSEEEPPPPEEEEPKVAIEEDQEKPKKQKKGKGKKKKQDVEEIPDFPKPKNWKKMQKKEREKWLEEQIVLWRIQKEQEKQAAIQEVKERRVREAKERVELTIRDQDEQDIRRNLLKKTCNLFRKFEKQKNDFLNSKQILAEWQQYLKCDGLPDPRIVTQMQTYLHKWQLLDACDDHELDKRANEVLPMLELLDVITANSRLYTERQVKLYDEVRRSLREEFSEAIEKASYFLIRNIEKNLTLESIKLATYAREFKGLRLNLWVVVRLPTRKPLEEEPDPVPVELQFPSMQVTVKLPTSIDSSCLCVRAARSMIDLLSESCRSYSTPVDVANRFMDLYTFNVEEHKEVYTLKAKQDEFRKHFYKDLNARIKEIEKTLKENVYAKLKDLEEELDRLYLLEPNPPLPDPRTFIGDENESNFRKYLKKCLCSMRKYEVNLRKYRICGGILHMDLLMTPPQPKRMRGEIEITTLSLPKKLQSISYLVQYRAPKPPGPETIRTPEEIEEQMRIVEAEYEKLALITIDLPVDIMWMEPPTVCQWQESNKLWTSKYINDFKYNEDKFSIQFRTGALWPIGLAVAKHTNLPFVSWDIRPDPYSKGVLLTVTGQIVAITWLCHGHFVRLKRISHNPTSALEGFINHKMSVKQMVQVMREAACDFFPDFDAHNYTQDTHQKEWVLERHTYHAMAYLSRAYNFQFSRWNSTAGSRNIVVQLREAVDKKREGRFQLINLTPQRATLLKCTENVTDFTLEPLVGMEFYPDLFTFNMSYGSVDARRTTFQMKYRLVETVFEMLQELKLTSFS